MRRLFALALLTACADAATTDSGVDGDVDDTQDIVPGLPFEIVDTDQAECYDTEAKTGCPAWGEALAGQDAMVDGLAPAYEDDGDGTVIDWNTGLVWQQEQLDGIAWSDADGICSDLDLGGRTDWRVPSTKELYSLILYSGATGTADPSGDLPADAVPYIDSDVFDWRYGTEAGGHRYIDVQFISTTVYVSSVFADDEGVEAGQEAFFGVNYADGRIKGYPTETGEWQLRCVAGNADYGTNDLSDNGDGTVVDAATGLQWQQGDSVEGMDWVDALASCEDLTLAGHDDWRLPNAKELQSIVDYTRSPDTAGSAAIDPVFEATAITNEDGFEDWGWYWSSTTHLDGMVPGTDAIYVTFGQALGFMEGPSSGEELYLDVHGAGSQRGDPKTGDAADYPRTHSPQGDVQRVFNLVRCVRDTE